MPTPMQDWVSAITVSSTPQSILSWAHFGDLHLTTRDQENFRHLQSLVAYANRVLAGHVAFVFLPGDNADDGFEDQYLLAEEALRNLNPRLYAIAGDHDLGTGGLDHFRAYLADAPSYAHTYGAYRLVFANAMEGPRREVFRLSPQQLAWLEEEFLAAAAQGLRIALFVHCYPSDFHEGGERLSQLIREYRVLLAEMGHTHYNELANDGTTIYAATRSTGQIEEGPAGFSLTTLDNDVVSWRFYELDALASDAPVALITTPSDRALITDSRSPQRLITGDFAVHARCWSGIPVQSATASLADQAGLPLHYDASLDLWLAQLSPGSLPDGAHPLTVRFHDQAGREVRDTIQIQINRNGPFLGPKRAPRDQDNAIGAYPEKAILGTQLGPNKNGRKW